MLKYEELDELLRDPGDVIGTEDTKIGAIGTVFVDDDTGEPEWVTVKTGLFGRSESFVPLQDATVDGSDIRVPFDKDTVKDAPRVDDDRGHLSADEESELYRYYAPRRAGGSDDDAADRYDATTDDDYDDPSSRPVADPDREDVALGTT